MTEVRKIITQGEHATSGDPDLVISTLLGSCVACCLWDPVARVGGINHMLVAGRKGAGGVPNETGVNAMELLINDILKLGGARSRLVAKVFGGASMVKGLSEIGAANSDFTLDYLSRERITCTSKSVGGSQARHLLFCPTTGQVRQKFVPKTQRQIELIDGILPVLVKGNGLELF